MIFFLTKINQILYPKKLTSDQKVFIYTYYNKNNLTTKF